MASNLRASVKQCSALAECKAYVVAHDLMESASLINLAEAVGFGAVELVGDTKPKTSTRDAPLSFFLVHEYLGDEAKATLLKRLRRTPADRIRFAPVVLFIEDQPFENIQQYFRMGFDDVVVIPERVDVLQQRLIGQMDTERLYVQTSSYIGPDRRRFESPNFSDSRRTGLHHHIRLFIKRNPMAGIKIVRQQVFF